MEPVIVPGHDGLPLAVWELAGDSDAPPVLVLHATGFHALCYRALADALAPVYRVIGLDFRGHGHSATPDLTPARDGSIPTMDWSHLAADTLTVIDALGLDRPVGVGHSCGGATLLRAEAERLGTFARLLCYEPILYPPGILPRGNGERPSMAQLAIKRRRSFASRQAAFDNYASKPPMNTLRADVLRDYVDGGFRDDDGGVTLRCAPEAEAATFLMSIRNGTFERLPAVACPVEVACGGAMADFGEAILEPAVHALPDARLHVFEDLSHMGPFEDPDRIAAWIADLRSP